MTSARMERLLLNSPHVANKQYLPLFIYGTAWKKERTADLVYRALCNNFNALDTACQPRHYREDLVGAGLRRAIQESRLKRSDVFVQTKFTSVDGQDPSNIPYDPKSELVDQVKKSIEVSLEHFSVSSDSPYLDSVVLHSPMRTFEETLDVWLTLETFVPDKIRNLGISNCNLFTLMDLHERATIKPAIVQNRFYATTKFDIGMRKFCKEKSIVYQSFWTLSANPQLAQSTIVKDLAAKLDVPRESALYCLVLALGNMVILNGTTSEDHMQADWQAVSKTRDYAASNENAWNAEVSAFRKLIGQSWG